MGRKYVNYTPTEVGGFLIHRLDFSPWLRYGAEVKSPKALIRAVPALYYNLLDYHKLIFFYYNFCITRLKSRVLEVECWIKSNNPHIHIFLVIEKLEYCFMEQFFFMLSVNSCKFIFLFFSQLTHEVLKDQFRPSLRPSHTYNTPFLIYISIIT